MSIENELKKDGICVTEKLDTLTINSIAKNILNITFSETFNPLAVYTCGGKSYVPRMGRHDFLRTRTAQRRQREARHTDEERHLAPQPV